jgi:hypothetical protein
MGRLLQSTTLWSVVLLVLLAKNAIAAAVALSGPAGSDPGHRLIRSTGLTATALWFVGSLGILTVAFTDRDRHGRHVRYARRCWWIGCAMYLIHVAVAFHLGHGWSHAVAYDHVEAGSGFGPGLFVSYTFTAVWAIDAAWWLLAPRAYRGRPGWVDLAVYGFLGFVVFNATVVFGTGVARWGGVFGFVILGVVGGWLVSHRE